MSNAIGVEVADEGKDIKDGLENVLGLGEKPAEPTTQSTEVPACGPWGCQDEPVEKV
ncbi:MAG TPA: hypothetical protein VG247_14220 [Pseudonocardiaceae bacterium]|jgi:hypothetical protein|nr:hypothetical protein [Pseudonocardiaceae bacterium]